MALVYARPCVRVYLPQDSLSGAVVEATMIVDTVTAVAAELAARGQLWRHPALFWTAVALLRSDSELLYARYAAAVLNLTASRSVVGRPSCETCVRVRRALTLLRDSLEQFTYLFASSPTALARLSLAVKVLARCPCVAVCVCLYPVPACSMA